MTSRPRAGLIMAATQLLFALGCSRPTPTGPPEVRLGEHECDHCRMIISEERFAAVARLADGSEKRFDDLGCLLASPARLAPQLWFGTESGWLGPEEIWIQTSEASSTPMGSGWQAVPRIDDSRGSSWKQLISHSDRGDYVAEGQTQDSGKNREVATDER